MPKILQIINRFNLGGPTHNVAYISKYLNSDYEVLLVGGNILEDEASSDYVIKNLGLDALIIPEMEREINGYNDIQAYFKIKNIIKKYKPDIVHTHASKAGFLGRYAAYNNKVPVIVHTFHGHIFHSYFGKPKTFMYKTIEREMAKKTSRIIAISEIQKKELCHDFKIAKEDKFSVIPLGLDLDVFQDNYKNKRNEFRNKYNIKDDEIAIAIIGRLVHIKNHNLFIKALSEVKKKTNKKIKALIVGDGELRNNLVSLAESLNLSCSLYENNNHDADIIFTSWIIDVDKVFAGVDIVALSSYNEGTPSSLIESQAANTPIVSTDVGGIRDIVLDNQTALLAKNNDLNDFSDKLFRLVDNDELRQKMSQNTGWEFVKEKFDYMRLVKDMENLYNELLQKM